MLDKLFLIAMNLCGDWQMMKTVVKEFLTDMPVRIQELKTAIEKSDIAAITIQAHSIRGAASYIGGEYFMAAAGELEQSTLSEDWSVIIKKTDTLKKTFENLKKELQKEFCE
jgi:HPt (histidine-containing phosphotransfer) domain-containing protein